MANSLEIVSVHEAFLFAERWQGSKVALPSDWLMNKDGFFDQSYAGARALLRESHPSHKSCGPH